MSTGEVAESGPSDDGESPIDQHRKAADRAWLITNALLVLGLGILIVVIPAIAIPLHRSAMRDASRDTDPTTPRLNHGGDSPRNDSLAPPDVADTNPSILTSDFSELNDELSQCSLQLHSCKHVHGESRLTPLSTG
jgi:hypothetical protein